MNRGFRLDRGPGSSRGAAVCFAACAIALLALTLAKPVLSSERLYRVVDRTNGVLGAAVSDVAQDRDGFLWITSSAGLARWDGVELRPWGRDEVASLLDWVAVGPDGEVITARDNGRLLRVVDDGLTDVTGPDGTTIDATRDAVFDRVGRLWVIDGGRLLRRGIADTWSEVNGATLDGQSPIRLGAACSEGVLVSTWQGGLWHASATGVEHLDSPPGVTVRLLCEDETRGDLLLGIRGNDAQRGIWRLAGGRLDRLAATSSRPAGMARRGELTVVSTPDELWLVDRGGAARPLGRGEYPDGLGRMTFDREGSLWIGSYVGLVHYPEIETVVWQEDDGLPSRQTRGIARAGDTMVVTTWAGLALIDADGARHEADWIGRDTDVCVDGGGRAWTRLSADYRRREPGEPLDAPVVSIEDGRVTRWPIEEGALDFGCISSPDGGVTFTAGRGLYSVEASGAPRQIARIAEDAAPPIMLAGPSGPDDASTLSFIAWPDRVCFLPTDRLDGTTVDDAPIVPVCERVDGAGIVHALLAFRGRLLIGTDRAGLLQRNDRGDWIAVRLATPLPVDTVLSLQTADQGLWLTSPGFIWRLLEDDGAWSVAEEINTWHGVPATAYGSLHEEEDGALWIASLAGVIHVPAPVRRRSRQAPKTRLTGLYIDGSPVDERDLRLPFRRNRLEILFSALSYRATDLLRYRVRLGPTDTWSELREPSVRFADLRPGRYRLECAASLDGRNWTERPAIVGFTVLRPWYLQGWAIALFLSILAALVYIAFRLRLARAVALEQQRLRIAMDLHDELGAGLGSIGILTGLAAESDTEPASRMNLVRRASALAATLSQSLADIVWALRPDTPGLEDLGHHIVDRAAPMFAEGEIEFASECPTEPTDQAVSLAVRRNVMLIALEALHNAAEHASASRVTFRLAPADGRWTMLVSDDGIGIGNAKSSGTGLGMSSMQRRAEEIGADLSIVSAPGAGTRVELAFDPRAEGIKR